MNSDSWVPWAAAIMLNGVGFCGAFFVVYAVISMRTAETWPPIEKYAPRISSFLAILGTLVVTVSAWFPSNPNPASPISTHFTGLVVLVSCLLALFYLFRRDLPTTLVNGMTILGLVGALFRILPLPYFGP